MRTLKQIERDLIYKDEMISRIQNDLDVKTEKIKDWKNRMKKELDKAPAYLYPQCIEIIKEMELELE